MRSPAATRGPVVSAVGSARPPVPTNKSVTCATSSGQQFPGLASLWSHCPRLLKLRELDGVAARAAHAAVERVVHDEGAQGLMALAAEHVDGERVGLRVVPADATTAEPPRS